MNKERIKILRKKKIVNEEIVEEEIYIPTWYYKFLLWLFEKFIDKKEVKSLWEDAIKYRANKISYELAKGRVRLMEQKLDELGYKIEYIGNTVKWQSDTELPELYKSPYKSYKIVKSN